MCWLLVLSILSFYSLTDDDLKDIDKLSAKLFDTICDVTTFIRPLFYLILCGMCVYGIYVFFNGFMGYQFDGMWKWIIGFTVFPLVPFVGWQILQFVLLVIDNFKVVVIKKYKVES